MGLYKTQLKKPVDMFNKVVDDRKTYLLIIVGIVLGVLEAMGWITIPDRVDTLLLLVGAGTLRHSISKSKKLTKELIEVTEKR